MPASRTWLAAALALALALLLAPTAHATNGMYLTAYGTEAMGRGGANLAISDRSLAIGFNPAGIAQLQGNHFSANLATMAPSLEFENMVNGPTDAKSRYFTMPSVAYVRGAKGSPWTWGIGFIGQGGMGATFEKLNTFFGTVDGTYTQVRFMTISPTVAYSFSEDFAVGATMNVGYADASFRFFPGTSFFNTQMPAMSFFGVKMENAHGYQQNFRLGAWWRPHPKVSLGAIYQTETDSTFDNGDMQVNFTGHPLLGRKVHYDGKMDGFTFAAQAGLGIALRPNDRWTIALDVKKNYWDDALNTITVSSSNPDTPGAPDVVMPFVFNWKDQWVYALGVDYRASERLTLRAGYNFGENPVPAETLTPLFPATVEKHATIGMTWMGETGRTYELALEHAFNASQTNNNVDPFVNPFGPGARVDHSQWTLSFGVSWAWARK